MSNPAPPDDFHIKGWGCLPFVGDDLKEKHVDMLFSKIPFNNCGPHNSTPLGGLFLQSSPTPPDRT